MSDVSDCSDLFRVEVEDDLGYTTMEDEDLQYISEMKVHLREYPLLPPRADDATQSFMDVDKKCQCVTVLSRDARLRQIL